MSRVSLNRRIDRLRALLNPRGCLDWRVDQLSDDDRAAWRFHVERTGAIILRAKNRGENAYATWLADPLALPSMPRSLRHALWPELAKVDAERNPSVAYSMLLELAA